MADYYHYRQKIEKQRRRRNAVVALMVVLIILCAAAGFFWMSRHNQQANTPQAEPTMPTAETAATATPEQPEPTAQTPGNPQRLLPAVDNAAWDTATPVEQTIDLEYLNTDSRMAALPALGTVGRSHFDTVTFLGDSITEGMECYATGYQNAHVRAYCAETIRAALESVPAGQMEAGYCVGMTYLQTMRRIVLPQALRTAFPPLFNSLISLLKDTSLAANITVTEMFMATQRIVARTYESLPLYLEVAFIYLMFSTILTQVQRWGEKKLNAKGFSQNS